jgi:hypothetical protein
MTCPSCDGHGVFRIGYTDGSASDYAICLCDAGERMRIAKNHGIPVTPHWQIWAHRQGIALEQVAPMEDLLTDEELAARGFTAVEAPQAIDAIAAAARSRSKK